MKIHLGNLVSADREPCGCSVERYDSGAVREIACTAHQLHDAIMMLREESAKLRRELVHAIDDLRIPRRPLSFRQRLAVAWRVLRGGM